MHAALLECAVAQVPHPREVSTPSRATGEARATNMREHVDPCMGWRVVYLICFNQTSTTWVPLPGSRSDAGMGAACAAAGLTRAVHGRVVAPALLRTTRRRARGPCMQVPTVRRPRQRGQARSGCLCRKLDGDRVQHPGLPSHAQACARARDRHGAEQCRGLHLHRCTKGRVGVVPTVRRMPQGGPRARPCSMRV